ncbi:hypothetical protein ABZ512_08490 [Nocardiopsis dassonvillei]|uniref:hypothetical protein n=1 Tax=Nocardiopsis dassonvillei TaxID=2014 RepID=UPI0034037CCA
MRHPPPLARPLLLAGFLCAFLTALPWVPAPAHASPDYGTSSAEAGAFYARVLEEHGGVFVEEELAGVLDRRETAEDLRALLEEYGVTVDVLVMADHGHHDTVYDLALAVNAHSDRPLLVLPVDSIHIGHAQPWRAGVPTYAVEYATATGGWSERPVDKLERVLRVSDHPDLEALTEQAWDEIHARPDVAPPESGTPAQTPARATLFWREYRWVPWAGGALGTALTYTAVVAALRWYRHARSSRGEVPA